MEQPCPLFVLNTVHGPAVFKDLRQDFFNSCDHVISVRQKPVKDVNTALPGPVCLLVVRVVQPAMANSLLLRIPERIGWPILGVLYVTFLADFVVTVMIVAGLNKKLRELDEVQRRMRIVSDGLSEKLGEGTMRAQTTIEEQRLQATLAKYEARDAMQNQKKKMQEKASQAKAQRRDSKERASALKEKILSGRFFGSRRILEAFPNMKHREYDAALMDVQRDLQINEKERKE